MFEYVKIHGTDTENPMFEYVAAGAIQYVRLPGYRKMSEKTDTLKRNNKMNTR